VQGLVTHFPCFDRLTNERLLLDISVANYDQVDRLRSDEQHNFSITSVVLGTNAMLANGSILRISEIDEFRLRSLDPRDACVFIVFIRGVKPDWTHP
jgi:hypothetical protein